MAATFSGCTFTRNTAETEGGAIELDIYSSAASLTLSDCLFDDNYAQVGGAVRLGGMIDVDITGSTFRDNYAPDGGGAVLVPEGVLLALSDSRFDNNHGGLDADDKGGALYVTGADLSVSRTTFCGNVATQGGGVYVSGTASGTTWHNNIFQDNEAATGGGIYFARAPGTVFTNNTLVGNIATGGGGGIYFDDSTGTFSNNIVSSQPGGFGIYAGDGTSGTGAVFTWSDFFANAPADLGGTFVFSTTSDGNTIVDPTFIRYTADGDCSNDLLGLSATSPLLDAGDPTLQDLDGTPSAMGASGGPDAAGIDGDFDGYIADDDCDDTRPAVNPGAPEVCNDVDDDCDGVVDGATLDLATTWYDDVDGDGFGDAATGRMACVQPDGTVTDGTDCADDDASVFPGATEILDDRVDQDCDGLDTVTDPGDSGEDSDSGDPDDSSDTSGIGADPDDSGIVVTDAGCGCATSPEPRTALLLPLALLGGLARRLGPMRRPDGRATRFTPASTQKTPG